MASPLPLAANRSFTSLSRSDVEQEPSAADRDLTVVPESPVSTVEATASTDVLATLGAAGSLLGDQLHRALEDHLGNGRAIDQAVAGFDSPDAWRDSLASILDTAIEPVPGLRFRLSDLRGDCITEMQFLLPVDRISAKMLSAVFVDDPRLQSMAGGRDWAEQLTGWSFTEFTGFLQGFIDLVFERDGRWYVADYKSNRLVRYNPAALDRVMLEANYFLQARIYLLALHRHLRAHLPGYDPDRHLGGVAYLFVRGFPAQGVWFDAPSAEALDRFDALFQHPALHP
jgi:exodeoxyribonuclease V beta subunit